jgi:hypothetical protein
MGAVTAILFAEKNLYKRFCHISCLVLDSPFSSVSTMVSDVAKNQMNLPSFISSMGLHIMKNTIKSKINFDVTLLEPIVSVQKLTIPAAFIYAKEDKLVYPIRMNEYYNVYRGKNKILIPSEFEHNSDREPACLQQAYGFIQNAMNHETLRDVNDVHDPYKVAQPIIEGIGMRFSHIATDQRPPGLHQGSFTQETYGDKMVIDQNGKDSLVKLFSTLQQGNTYDSPILSTSQPGRTLRQIGQYGNYTVVPATQNPQGGQVYQLEYKLTNPANSSQVVPPFSVPPPTGSNPYLNSSQIYQGGTQQSQPLIRPFPVQEQDSTTSRRQITVVPLGNAGGNTARDEQMKSRSKSEGVLLIKNSLRNVELQQNAGPQTGSFVEDMSNSRIRQDFGERPNPLRESFGQSQIMPRIDRIRLSSNMPPNPPPPQQLPQPGQSQNRFSLVEPIAIERDNRETTTDELLNRYNRVMPSLTERFTAQPPQVTIDGANQRVERPSSEIYLVGVILPSKNSCRDNREVDREMALLLLYLLYL